MIAILSYNRSQKEQYIIEQGCRSQVGKKTEDKMLFMGITKHEELDEIIKEGRLIHFIYYEIRDNRDINALRGLRKADDSAFLMLLTSSSVSPMNYLKPGLSPDALLLRPFGQKEFDQVNEELFDSYMEKLDAEQKNTFFMIRTREENCRIPCSKILYFEANNKKITVRVESEEYEIYDSIENIQGTVPQYFVRIHRSYLVNSKKIRRARLTEGMIELEQGVVVPVSRTYKQKLKELLK